MIRVAPRYHHHCPNKGERDSILDTHRKKGFPGGSDGKESACNAGDLGSTPGGEHGNPLQYSCLENPHEQSSPWGCKELDMTEQLSPAQHSHEESGPCMGLT